MSHFTNQQIKTSPINTYSSRFLHRNMSFLIAAYTLCLISVQCVCVFILYFLIFSPCVSSGSQSYSAFFPWLDCCTKSQCVCPGLQVDGKKSVLSAAVVLYEHTEEIADELPSSLFIHTEFPLGTFVYLYSPLPFG